MGLLDPSQDSDHVPNCTGMVTWVWPSPAALVYRRLPHCQKKRNLEKSVLLSARAAVSRSSFSQRTRTQRCRGLSPTEIETAARIRGPPFRVLSAVDGNGKYGLSVLSLSLAYFTASVSRSYEQVARTKRDSIVFLKIIISSYFSLCSIPVLYFHSVLNHHFIFALDGKGDKPIWRLYSVNDSSHVVYLSRVSPGLS